MVSAALNQVDTPHLEDADRTPALSKSPQVNKPVRGVMANREALLNRLPQWAIDIIRNCEDPRGKVDSSDGSRMLWAVLWPMANRGFTDDEVIDILVYGKYALGEHVGPKSGGKRRVGMDSAQERIDWLMGGGSDFNWPKAKKGVAKEPAPSSRDDVELIIKKILDDAYRKPFRAGSYDRAVMVYLCDLAHRLGRIDVWASQDRIALAVGMSPTRGGPSKVINRLVAGGFLEVRRLGGQRHTQEKATVYRPKRPIGGVQARKMPRGAPAELETAPISPLLAHDAFARENGRGLGRSAAVVLRCLAHNGSWMRSSWIAALEGVSNNSVGNALELLASRGLVYSRPDKNTTVWRLANRDIYARLNSIAVEEGTVGADARRREIVRLQRIIRAGDLRDQADASMNVSVLKRTVMLARGENVQWGRVVREYATDLLNEGLSHDDIYDRAEALRKRLEDVEEAFKQAFSWDYRWVDYVDAAAVFVLEGDDTDAVIDQLQKMAEETEFQERLAKKVAAAERAEQARQAEADEALLRGEQLNQDAGQTNHQLEEMSPSECETRSTAVDLVSASANHDQTEATDQERRETIAYRFHPGSRDQLRSLKDSLIGYGSGATPVVVRYDGQDVSHRGLKFDINQDRALSIAEQLNLKVDRLRRVNDPTDCGGQTLFQVAR
ncbi:hypothetical protein RE9425_03330 [Prescottella equi]|nr:hypothetical protein RE9425_03330 [Prescottella equi]